MELPRLNKCVRQVVKLQRSDDGSLEPVVVYKGGTQKRKSSSALKPLERTVRKMANAQLRFAQSYLDKHKSSSRKRRDGWLKDFGANIANAGTKGQKALTKKSMTWPKILKVN